MEQETPSNQDLALRLFMSEQTGDSNPEDYRSVVPRIFEKLNTHLSRRLGSEGYIALLKRAVVLAAIDHPRLASVRVADQGILEGVISTSAESESSEASEDCMAILASLIGLLDTFIGRKLCLRVLDNLWPNAARLKNERAVGDSNGQSGYD